MKANNRIERYAGSAGAPPARLMRDVEPVEKGRPEKFTRKMTSVFGL